MKNKILPIMLCSIFALTGCGNTETSMKEVEVIPIENDHSETTQTDITSFETSPTESYKEEDTSIISQATEENNFEKEEAERIGFQASNEIMEAALSEPKFQMGNKIIVLGESKVSELLEEGATISREVGVSGDSSPITADYIIDPNTVTNIYVSFDKCYFRIGVMNLSDEFVSVKDCIIYEMEFDLTSNLSKDTLYNKVLYAPGGIESTNPLTQITEHFGEPDNIEGKSYEDTLTYVYRLGETMTDTAMRFKIDRNSSSVVGFSVLVKMPWDQINNVM